MKALAKKISNSNVKAHVAAYSSRPILHVRTEGGGPNASRAYTFIDAVLRYGSTLVQQDLDEAYRRAGTAFRGQLEQHFVVLRESGTSKKLPTAPTAPGRKRRRAMSGDESESKKKSSK
jgi:hypothetical protein